jgi:hypothetical protein
MDVPYPTCCNLFEITSDIYDFVKHVKFLNNAEHVGRDMVTQIRKGYENIMQDFDDHWLEHEEIKRLLFMLNYEYEGSVKRYLAQSPEVDNNNNDIDMFRYLSNRSISEMSKDITGSRRENYNTSFDNFYSKIFQISQKLSMPPKDHSAEERQQNDKLSVSSSSSNDKDAKFRSNFSSNSIQEDQADLKKSKRVDVPPSQRHTDFRSAVLNKYIKNFYFFLKKLRAMEDKHSQKEDFEEQIAKVKAFESGFEKIKGLNLDDVRVENENLGNINEINNLMVSNYFEHQVKDYEYFVNFCKRFQTFAFRLLIHDSQIKNEELVQQAEKDAEMYETFKYNTLKANGIDQLFKKNSGTIGLPNSTSSNSNQKEQVPLQRQTSFDQMLAKARQDSANKLIALNADIERNVNSTHRDTKALDHQSKGTDNYFTLRDYDTPHEFYEYNINSKDPHKVPVPVPKNTNSNARPLTTIIKSQDDFFQQQLEEMQEQYYISVKEEATLDQLSSHRSSIKDKGSDSNSRDPRRDKGVTFASRGSKQSEGNLDVVKKGYQDVNSLGSNLSGKAKNIFGINSEFDDMESKEDSKIPQRQSEKYDQIRLVDGSFKAINSPVNQELKHHYSDINPQSKARDQKPSTWNDLASSNKQDDPRRSDRNNTMLELISPSDGKALNNGPGQNGLAHMEANAFQKKASAQLNDKTLLNPKDIGNADKSNQLVRGQSTSGGFYQNTSELIADNDLGRQTSSPEKPNFPGFDDAPNKYFLISDISKSNTLAYRDTQTMNSRPHAFSDGRQEPDPRNSKQDNQDFSGSHTNKRYTDELEKFFGADYTKTINSNFDRLSVSGDRKFSDLRSNGPDSFIVDNMQFSRPSQGGKAANKDGLPSFESSINQVVQQSKAHQSNELTKSESKASAVTFSNDKHDPSKPHDFNRGLEKQTKDDLTITDGKNNTEANGLISPRSTSPHQPRQEKQTDLLSIKSGDMEDKHRTDTNSLFSDKSPIAKGNQGRSKNSNFDAEFKSLEHKFDQLLKDFNDEADHFGNNCSGQKFSDTNFPSMIYSLIDDIKLDNRPEWKIFEWRRFSNLLDQNLKVVFKNEKIDSHQQTCSSQNLLTIFKSLSKFEESLPTFFIKDYRPELGKLTLKNFTDESTVFLDDYLPVQLNYLGQSSLSSFSFPFITPRFETHEVNILFPILEKYLAKMFGNYELLNTAPIELLFKYFSHAIEIVDIGKLKVFSDSQKDAVLKEIHQDFLDPQKIVYLYQKTRTIRLSYIKLMKPNDKGYLLLAENAKEQRQVDEQGLLGEYSKLIIVRFHL